MTKYPILLVHGMVIKDMFFFKSFGKITASLKKQGYHVYVSHQDGIGSIENNAIQLKNEIEGILLQEKAEKINLIAHSKGGLDCRYLISKLEMSERIASLTTLSTPHSGSKLADKILKLPKWIVNLICFYWNTVYKIFGDKNPDLYLLGNQLKTDSIVRFNEEILPQQNVFYQSYSAQIFNGKSGFLMKIPYLLQQKVSKKESDGLVEVESTKYGIYKGLMMKDSLSHSEMIAVFCRKKKRENVIEFYALLCYELKEKGF